MLLELIRIEFFIPSLGHNIISSRCLCYPIFQQFFCKSCGKISKLKRGKHISLLSKMKHTKRLTLYQIVHGTFHNLQILKYHHRESELCTESSTSVGWSAGLNHRLTADFTQPHMSSSCLSKITNYFLPCVIMKVSLV